MTAEVVFVASHTNAINHFQVFQAELKKRGITSEFIKNEDLSQVERVSQIARIIFVGIGSLFCLKVIERFREKVIVYYDNPKRDVLGVYGEIAKQVIQEGTPVMYANKHLAVEGGDIGLGYLPLQRKKILYLGSAADNNAGFSHLVEAIKGAVFERPTTITYRHHPRGDRGQFAELKQLEKENLAILEDANAMPQQSIQEAHQVCYYQTTLELDIRMMRRDHRVVTSAEGFAEWISDRAVLEEEFGYNPNWAELLYEQIAPIKVEE